jgi:hypothetical protein
MRLHANKRNPTPLAGENQCFRFVMCDYDRKFSEKGSRKGN